MQLPKKRIIHKHFTSNFKYLNQILSQKILTYFCQNNLCNKKCNLYYLKKYIYILEAAFQKKKKKMRSTEFFLFIINTT